MADDDRPTEGTGGLPKGEGFGTADSGPEHFATIAVEKDGNDTEALALALRFHREQPRPNTLPTAQHPVDQFDLSIGVVGH